MKESREDSCGCCHCHKHKNDEAHHAHNHNEPENNCHCNEHDHRSRFVAIGNFLPEILSGILMVTALLIDWSSRPAEIFAYITALLPVGIPILTTTIKEWLHGDIFNEFTLMVGACVGAFLIGEYPESVAILLFYSFGEKLEDVVSDDVKGQIRNLLGKMPQRATVINDGQRIEKSPEEVKKGERIAVKAGESVPLDGILTSTGGASFNTAAITGESLPQFIESGRKLNSGFIPLDTEVTIEVTNEWNNSSMTRIMNMIEDASRHRAPSETVLRKITRWYTPIVFGCALLLFIIPWLVSLGNSSFVFEWSTWLRRSLVFLVCSCPCALIISIPLTYFASIGIASKKGILFKGHEYLDNLRKADVMLFDKTGTVTTGNFHIVRIECRGQLSERQLLSIVATAEQSSRHPLASAIVNEARRQGIDIKEATSTKTERHGIMCLIEGKEYAIGSMRYMQGKHIKGIEPENCEAGTTVYIATDGEMSGCIILSDTVKPKVIESLRTLRSKGIAEIGILSGDVQAAADKAKSETGADFAYGALMPEDKQTIIREKQRQGATVAFAGDGINDAPALAAADISIAMGASGTDLAIESAGIIVATDDLEKINEGIDISRKVKSVIIENVSFAFGIKLIVMTLGAFGIATLWAAVFADTGVTVVTVLWTLFRLKIWQLRKTKNT